MWRDSPPREVTDNGPDHEKEEEDDEEYVGPRDQVEYLEAVDHARHHQRHSGLDEVVLSGQWRGDDPSGLG